MACCQRELTGSASIRAPVSSKFSTCMVRKSSWSRRKMEYSEMPDRLSRASISGHTLACAASYAASVPSRKRKRKAILCINYSASLLRQAKDNHCKRGEIEMVRLFFGGASRALATKQQGTHLDLAPFAVVVLSLP